MKRARSTLLMLYVSLLFCVSSSASGQGQLAEEVSVPEPTQLQIAAEADGSTLVLSKLLGEIKSDDSVATFFVIEVEGADGERVRGVKISLENAESSDRIYVTESLLAQFQDELREIESWRHRIGNCQVQIRCIQGIARCRPSGTEIQAYCPGRFSTPKTKGGFLLDTPRNTFSFPSVEATQFDDRIGGAIQALVY